MPLRGNSGTMLPVKGGVVTGELEAKWMSPRQVAGLLGVNEETVRRWIRSGDLPVLSLGSARAGYRIRHDDLVAFIRARYGPIYKAVAGESQPRPLEASPPNQGEDDRSVDDR